jgi:hypothetical protein
MVSWEATLGVRGGVRSLGLVSLCEIPCLTGDFGDFLAERVVPVPQKPEFLRLLGQIP